MKLARAMFVQRVGITVMWSGRITGLAGIMASVLFIVLRTGLIMPPPAPEACVRLAWVPVLCILWGWVSVLLIDRIKASLKKTP